ncbi:MAG: hypothetical protein CO128_04730 [Ignavibacteriales bacterium CG_4_9_14_3_um_filter_30_11]|nr:MAG: hypothetical protein CO128_04730 [Ignavibacteriales bacterium CG_4_9_14_3_um_filter_30_11]
MKKINFIAFFILISFTTIFSQTEEYFDAPFGGGLGYNPGWIIPNVDIINTQIKSLGIPEFSKSGFYTSGISGFIYLGFLKQVRVGGFSFGGSTSRDISIAGINKEAVYSLSGGGLTIEYTLPYVRDWGISIGTIIGRGSLELELFQNKGSVSWSNIWTDLSTNTSQNINKKLKNSYWFLTPTLNIDIPVDRFISFRIGAGYQFTFGDKWKLDNDVDISGVPSDLNADSYFIQTGVFIGFFSF